MNSMCRGNVSSLDIVVRFVRLAILFLGIHYCASIAYPVDGAHIYLDTYMQSSISTCQNADDTISLKTFSL